MSCKWFEENLARYIHLEMNEDELLKADEHLSGCEICANVYDEALNASILIGKHLQNHEEVALSKEKREKIISALKPKTEIVKKPKISLSTLFGSVAAVLMAVVGAYILLVALLMPERNKGAGTQAYEYAMNAFPPDYRNSTDGDKKLDVQNIAKSGRNYAIEKLRGEGQRFAEEEKIKESMEMSGRLYGLGIYDIEDDYNSDGEFKQDVTGLKFIPEKNITTDSTKTEAYRSRFKGEVGSVNGVFPADMSEANVGGKLENGVHSADGQGVIILEDGSQHRPAAKAPPPAPKALSEGVRMGAGAVRSDYYEGGYLTKKSNGKKSQKIDRLKETNPSSQDKSLTGIDDIASAYINKIGTKGSPIVSYKESDRPAKNRMGRGPTPILGDIPTKGELFKNELEKPKKSRMINGEPVDKRFKDAKPFLDTSKLTIESKKVAETGAGFLSDVNKLDDLPITGGAVLGVIGHFDIADAQTEKQVEQEIAKAKKDRRELQNYTEAEAYSLLEKAKEKLKTKKELARLESENIDYANDGIETSNNDPGYQKLESVGQDGGVAQSKEWLFKNYDESQFDTMETKNDRELVKGHSSQDGETIRAFTDEEKYLLKMIQTKNYRAIVEKVDVNEEEALPEVAEAKERGGREPTELLPNGVDDDNDGVVRDKKKYDSENVKERVQRIIAGEALDSEEGTSVEVFQGKLTVIHDEQINGADHDAIYDETSEEAAEKEEQSNEPAVDEVVTYNPFTITSQDALSTFSIDTDTASFELAQKYLSRNKIPRANTIRVEEFVNAMDYQYPISPQKDFSIYTELMPSPFRANIQLLKVAIKAKVLGRDQVKPNHLIFVIDASGSMARKDRMPLVQKGILGMLDHLQANDHISIISFGTGSQILLQNCPVTEKESIIYALESLQTGGSTNLLAGLKKGYDVALNHLDTKVMNRMVVCSDGVTNVGERDAKIIIDSVVNLRSQGISCTTIGFGAGDYNDHLMESIANKGDGFYLYINSENDLNRVFSQQFVSSLEVVARDVKLQVSFDPKKVYRYRLLGYENRNIADKDFRNDKVDAGEISSGKAVTAIYELEIVPQAFESRLEDQLGRVFVRFKSDDSNVANEISQNINADSFQEREPTPYFKLATYVAEFAEMLRLSPYAKNTKTRELIMLVEGLEALLPRDIQVLLLKNMIIQYGQLSGR